jgi:ankyrin repeat protein
LQELKKSKSTRPRSVKAALLALPQTLDETYERMLNSISEDDRPYALTFLRWLAYSKSPLSLNELTEASIIEPTEDLLANDVVDVANRGGWGDVLEILAGLVTTEGADRDVHVLEPGESDAAGDSAQEIQLLKSGRRVEPNTKVRLAHFSVKEYLESSRLRSSDASVFALVSATDHRFLTQSCLAYLEYYSESPQKTSTTRDLEKFPLLEYAACWWYEHALLQESGSSAREMNLLTSTARLSDWLCVHDPDHEWEKPFQIMPGDVARLETPLYYSSLLGLEPIVREVLSAGADVNAHNGSATYAASFQGYANILRILISGGAEVNVFEPEHGYNALHAASRSGNVDALQVLVDAGADVNYQAWDYKNLLYIAASENDSELVRIFVQGGADVNAASGEWGDAIQVASMMGYETIVRMLIEGGANVNACEGHYGSALYVAASQGRKQVVQMLLEAGADVNAQVGHHGSALQAALKRDHVDKALVRLLIDAGADLNAPGECHDKSCSRDDRPNGESIRVPG